MRRVVDVLGRIGLVGYGEVHLLVAGLSLQVAFGVPDAPPDASTALRTLGATTFGAGLLVVVAAGFAAFGLFCFADAATRRA